MTDSAGGREAEIEADARGLHGRSTPRKKLSGSAALAVLGNGWSKRLYGSTCPVARDGPDVILEADARDVPGFEHVSRKARLRDV